MKGKFLFSLVVVMKIIIFFFTTCVCVSVGNMLAGVQKPLPPPPSRLRALRLSAASLGLAV